MPVTVKLMQGNLTHDTDFFPIVRMDPYVYITIGGERRKSSICRSGGRNPSWTDVFTFPNNANDMQLKIEVWDKDTFTRDDLIGDGFLDLTPFMNGMPVNQYVNLTYKGRGAGNILLGIQCTPNPNMMNPNMGMGGMGMPMGGMQAGYQNFGSPMMGGCPNYRAPMNRMNGCGGDPSWDPNFTSF